MDLDKEKIDINKNCPLSIENWIIVLNTEISNLKYPDLMIMLNPIIIFLITFIGFMITSVNTPLLPIFSSIWRPIWTILLILTVIAIIFFSIDYNKTHKKKKKIKKLRDKIIFGELTDSNKIRNEWKKVTDS